MTIKINSDDDAVSLRFEITAILREEIGFHEQYAATLAEPIVNGLRKGSVVRRSILQKIHARIWRNEMNVSEMNSMAETSKMLCVSMVSAKHQFIK